MAADARRLALVVDLGPVRARRRVFPVMLVERRIRIEIGEEGFSQVSFFGVRFLRWEDCSPFEVLSLRLPHFVNFRMIRYTARVVDRRGRSRTKDLAIQNVYRLKPAVLTAHLNAARERRLNALRFPPDPTRVSTRTLTVDRTDRVAPAGRR